MKKGSGSRVCCLEWVALRSHSKPFCFPVLLVRPEGHGRSSATVTPQLRVFGADFHLSAFFEHCFHYMPKGCTQNQTRLFSSNSPSEYVCKPRVQQGVLCNTNCTSLLCNHTISLISFTSKGPVYLLEMTKQRANVGGSRMHVHSRTMLWSHLNAESLGL